MVDDDDGDGDSMVLFVMRIAMIMKMLVMDMKDW